MVARRCDVIHFDDVINAKINQSEASKGAKVGTITITAAKNLTTATEVLPVVCANGTSMNCTTDLTLNLKMTSSQIVVMSATTNKILCRLHPTDYQTATKYFTDYQLKVLAELIAKQVSSS